MHNVTEVGHYVVITDGLERYVEVRAGEHMGCSDEAELIKFDSYESLIDNYPHLELEEDDAGLDSALPDYMPE
jgi:hypothetical protein